MNKGGFTLVEVLISTALLALLLAGMYGVLTVGEVIYRDDMNTLDLQQGVRQAMDGMLREIRQSGPLNITIDGSGERVDFSIPQVDNEISYYLQGGQIIREHPANTLKILANDIGTVNFACVNATTYNETTCLASPVFQIQIRGQKTVGLRTFYFPANTTLTEEVRLRN